MDQQALIAEQDALRTKRSFIGLLSSALGVNDQSYANTDAQAINTPGQYQVAGPAGSYGIEGRPVSNVQGSALLASPAVLILGALLIGVLVLRR